MEDGATASFAGQLESLGGLTTRAELVAAYVKADDALRQAVADALVHHLPNERAEHVARLLRDPTPH